MENSKRKHRIAIAVLLAVMLLSQLFAAMISSDTGAIKIESIMLDARGAELSADLYYPAGTTDRDRSPAVIVAPGAGCTKEHMRSFAEELAKRDYVVLNVNPYGSGLSETPVYNENGMGIEEYNIFATPLGVLDAVHFVRQLEFVDATRIGLTGHSQGSRRTGYAALMDCGYYTFNDVMLNLLHDTFNVALSEEDIQRDADAIAKEKLSPDAMTAYETLKAQYKADYDCMVKSLCLVGSTAQYCNPTAIVEVAGYEVTRTCKVNECIINGSYDFGYKSFNNADDTKAAWYIDASEDIVNGTYYALDDMTASSQAVGTFRVDGIGSNSQLAEAIENRSLRMVLLTPETHSKNFFSPQTTAMVIDYFNQTLNNHADTLVTAKSSLHFVYRELLNLIAMLAMLGLLIPFSALFMAREPLSCTDTVSVGQASRISRILIPVLTVVIGFIAIYIDNQNKYLITFKSSLALPLMITAWAPVGLLYWLAAGAVIILAVYLILNRKNPGFRDFLNENFRIGIKGIGSALLFALAFTAVAYALMECSEYFFKQDFRFWMVAFGQLKANHWMYVFSYAALMLPCFFILSMVINYLSDGMGLRNSARDVLAVVVVNSAGIWLCCLISFVMAYAGIKTDNLFSSFILTYGTLLSVPINVFIMRKTYDISRNVWAGVFACALLNAWLLVSVSGMNGMYIPQSWMSIFLGQ